MVLQQRRDAVPKGAERDDGNSHRLEQEHPGVDKKTKDIDVLCFIDDEIGSPMKDKRTGDRTS